LLLSSGKRTAPGRGSIGPAGCLGFFEKSGMEAGLIFAVTEDG